jgi:hypothetical protein
VSHKKSILVVVAALGAIVLGGIVSVSLSASESVRGEPVGYSPNHHPRSVNG